MPATLGRTHAISLLTMIATVPVTVLAFSVWISWGQIWNEAETELRRTAVSVAEYAARTLDGHMLLAERADALLNGMSDEAIRAAEREVHTELRRMAAIRPYVLTFYAIDAEGRPLVSANLYPAPREGNIADRDFFQALRKDPAPEVFVSKVGIGRFDNQLFFSIAERRGIASGKAHPFRGVVLVSLRPNELAVGLRLLASDSADRISLVRADGERLAHSSGFDQPPPPIGPDDPLRAVMNEEARNAVVYGHPPATDRAIAAYQRVEGWPIYASVSRSYVAVRAAWWQVVFWQLAFSIPAAFALLLVVVYALRRQREAVEARSALRVAAERHQFEAEMRQGQKLQALGQLAAGIAHDFNNILHAVQAKSAQIERNAGNRPTVRAALRGMDDVIKRGSSITSRLLAFARKSELKGEPIDPARLFTDMRDLLRTMLGASIRLVVDVPDDLPALRADREQLQTALINLITNARDAMPTGGVITLAARAVRRLEDLTSRGARALEPGPYVEITVRDTGIGMDAVTLSRAEEPFFTTKPVGQGTGLGVSMVKGFAEQSGGAMSIESVPGEGTQVRLWFPQTDAKAARSGPL